MNQGIQIDLKRLVELREKTTPRPWPVTDEGDLGYMLNCGPHKIFCHDSVTLEFISLAVGLADAIEIRKHTITKDAASPELTPP